MAISNNRLAGPGYIILNVLRVMNIISLLAVATASMVMLIKTFIVSKFFFFDACSHVITTSTSLFLIVSELSIFKNYFASNWPLLSPNHGFVALGMVMIVLGINTLGNLNKAATSQESLGLAFWRIVIGSGIVVFIMGVFNVVASYVFRDKSEGITARQVRAHGAVAASLSQHGDVSPMLQTSSPMSGGSTKSPFKVSFPRMNRDSVLPSYQPKSPIKSRLSRLPWKKDKNQDVAPTRPAMEISAPMNPNPQFMHLVKPAPTHPSDRSGGMTPTI